MILAVISVQGQYTKDTSFKYIRRINNVQGDNNIIEFWDSTSNRLLKTIDLRKESPYAHLPEKVINKDKVGSTTPVYKIEAGKTKGVIQKYCSEGEAQKIDSTMVLSMVSDYSASYNSQEYIAVLFILSIQEYAEPIYTDEILSTRSTIYVYDKKGNLKFKKDNIPFDGGTIDITNDGRYVAFNTDLDHGEGRVSNVKEGVVMYDMQIGKPIYRDTLLNTGKGMVENKYYVVWQNTPTSADNIHCNELRVINPYEKVLYIKTIDEKRLGPLKKMDLEKCVFINQNNQ